MIDYPFIPSYADRLAQPNRPNPLVHSNPGSHVERANRQRPKPIPRQPRSRNAQTATFNLKNNVSAAVPSITHCALSP